MAPKSFDESLRLFRGAPCARTGSDLQREPTEKTEGKRKARRPVRSEPAVRPRFDGQQEQRRCPDRKKKVRA